MVIELSDFESVVAGAADVRRQTETLDMLICNAGIMELPELELVNGVERQFAVNHLGHFVLVNQLLPQVIAAPQGRVVMVSSGQALRNAPPEGIDFDNLAGERSYYGFLAADHLQRPYQMNDSRVPYEKEQLESVEQIQGIVRARELYLAGKHLDARREWYHTTASLPEHELKLAALLAHRWGWHDRAILTASRAGYWSDLTLRFPLPHRKSIFANADQYDLDPALIYGVIRQESAFMKDARSPVGALGLMQLMPQTGKQTARSLKIRYLGSQALLHSDQNIRLGSAYLNKLLKRYNGSPVLAAAAYNAGPHRVSRWLPTGESMDASLWMERIPFKETRHYVRRVLAYATVFEWRLQRPVTRLSQRLPEIQQRY